jgi:hypothetical protein
MAALAAATWFGSAASAAYDGAQTGAARTVQLALPLPGDLLVARLDLRTDTSGARLPKLQFLGGCLRA